ncbi:uncharacterized protein LOC126278146 [Schistocerca gregaria]|uniref:uncharacterized protein LOC126278146 n=1 Tax=Schistocerca gregaria TaxID=7010 RepID=UPI00211E03B8|nr:uncharacterized protein LOC126278146 [Schistocerca gregaria]
MIENFPDELIIEILSHLSALDIVKGAQYVCQRWHILCKSPAVWKGKEQKIDGKHNTRDVVEIAKVIPHITSLCIGKSDNSDNFQAWFTGSHLYISSSIERDELKCIVDHLNIKNVSAPRSVISRCRSILFTDNVKLESLTVYMGNRPPPDKDDTFEPLVKQGSLAHLRALHFFGARALSADTISLLCQSCTDLEELCLHQSNNVTSEALYNLKNCSKLKILQITDTAALKDLSFLKYCPGVTELDISQCYSLRPAAFQHLLHLKNLKRFHMRHSNVNGLPLSAMRESMKQLKIIDLYYSYGYSEREVVQLKRFAPHITVLEGTFNFDKH